MFNDVCSNPDELLFWDNIHPTAIVHQIIAEEALEVLSSHTKLITHFFKPER